MFKFYILFTSCFCKCIQGNRIKKVRRIDPGMIILFICFFILLRASLPRPRFDQLMGYGWKVLLPLTLLNLAVTGGVVLATQG